jgi:hypothetical protein
VVTVPIDFEMGVVVVLDNKAVVHYWVDCIEGVDC